MIDIEITTRNIQLTQKDQFLASGVNIREALRPEFQSAISAKPITESYNRLRVAPITLKFMIRKYSEQLIYKPLREVQFWFS